MTDKVGLTNLYWGDMYAFDIMIDKMKKLQ
jgi:hypothetical protein